MATDTKTYLDHAATTPIDRRVVEAMQPYFNQMYGNPSSVHSFGQQAEAALEHSRETMAQAMNCKPHEIIFTSCGSESDNLALRGAAFSARKEREAKYIITTPVEHHAVTHTAQQLADLHGFIIEYLPVDEYGMVNPQDVADMLCESTAIVSIIYANNEIGTVNPLAEIGAICRERGIPLHTDAVQAAAYLPLDVQELQVDLIAIGAHKFYGPKGVGALYVREGISLLPAQTGGGQEYGLRAGTQNVPYIVGMAEALRLAQAEQEENINQLLPMRDRLIGQILEEIPDSQLTGHPKQRLPNHASFVFEGVDGNELLMMLDLEGFACSSGSACKTGDPEPSDVLTALKLERSWGLGSLRVTLGHSTAPEDIDAFLQALPDQVAKQRELNRN